MRDDTTAVPAEIGVRPGRTVVLSKKQCEILFELWQYIFAVLNDYLTNNIIMVHNIEYIKIIKIYENIINNILT